MWGALSAVSNGMSSALTQVASLIEGGSQDASSKSGATLLPWEHPGIPEAKRAEVEAQVRNLSVHRRTFMDPPPKTVTFSFTLDDARIALAMRLLEVDKELARWRWDIVPGKISEERFWKHYFFRVELVTDAAQSGDAEATKRQEADKARAKVQEKIDDDDDDDDDAFSSVSQVAMAADVSASAAMQLPERRKSDISSHETALEQESFATDETVY
jgi:hypothetical protein